MSDSQQKSPISITLQFDPEEMARRGRIGAYARLARHDPKSLTENARAAFLTKFEREVDPDGTLPEAERKRRAEYARKAHFARLARLSALSRGKKKAGGDAPAEAGEAA